MNPIKDSQCKNRSCSCRRFRPRDNTEFCHYCGHSIGFHDLTLTNQIFESHPLWRCNNCCCQRFKKDPLDPDRCYYCSHQDGYHLSWSEREKEREPSIVLNTAATPSVVLNTVTTPSVVFNDAATPSNSIPIPREIVQMVQVPPTRTRRVGRPIASILTINHIICFPKVSSNTIPKNKTDAWSNLESRGLIKKDVKISQDTSEKLDMLFRNLFNGRLDGQKWQLYDVSSGIPMAEKRELSFGVIKSNITKANKKLYIGPCEHDLDSLPLSRLETNLLLDSNTSTTIIDIVSLPPQLTNDSGVREFFNGTTTPG